MAVAQPDGEAVALEPRSQVQDSEHLHSIRRYGILLSYHAYLPEAESFEQFLNHLDMRDWLVSCGPAGGVHARQLLSREFPAVGRQGHLWSWLGRVYQCRRRGQGSLFDN